MDGTGEAMREMPHGGPREETGPRPRAPGWEVQRALGRGAHSTVWLVTGAGGEQAALKVPDRDPGLPTGLLQDEVRAVGELRHEHVVRPLGVVETDVGPGLLSEYHPGGSLGALVRAAGPLPLARVVTVLVPIAQALEALHAAGVVHGDVSPGNILFTVQGRPALADLGSSRVLGGAEHRLGTPGFAAPELEDGRGSGAGSGLDPAADLYSLAAVGWYALTGRAPARTTARVPLPMILPEVPREVVHLLEAGLDEDPARRPDAGRFAVACYRWADPEPLDLFAAATPELARELPTRRRPPAASGRRGGRWTRWVSRQRRGSRPRWTSRPRRGLLVGAGAVATTVLVGGLVWGGITGVSDQGGPDPVAGPTTAPGPSGSAAAESGSSGPAATPPSRPSPPRPPAAIAGADSPSAAEDLSTAVEALGPARARALTSLAEADLSAYSVPDSPAHRSDADLQEQLAERGLRFRGLELRTRVDGAVTREGPDRATVRMEVRIGPYRTVTDAGDAVEATDRETVEHLTARLQRNDHGWRVLRIGP